MANRALAVPQIVVNDVAIDIVANSASFVEGHGEYKTRIAHSGETPVVYNTKNIETQKGQILFSMVTSVDNIELARAWKVRFETNVVALTEKGMTRTLRRAIMENDPPKGIGVEGTFELIFTGTPLS